MASLVLAGPPGVGKSTVAQALADASRRPLADLDVMIEQTQGHSPANIITQRGEAEFRSIERKMLESMDHEPARGVTRIVSLGGGTLGDGASRTAARSLGPVLGLSATTEQLEQRAAKSDIERPLNAEGLVPLLERRALDYASVDATIDASGSEQDVLQRVQQWQAAVRFVTAEVGDKKSRVLFGPQLSEGPLGAVAALRPGRPILAVTDAGVPEATRRRFLDPIRKHFEVVEYEGPGGEAAKTWDVLGDILNTATQAGCGRQSVVVGLGGGATCDVAGLAASMLGRGAPLVLVPTTLLSQVDASVGGKCAVNLGPGRNLVGAFHPATDVFADQDSLNSLPEEEMRSGWAELMKMAILGDADLFGELEGHKPQARLDWIARSVELKAAIVREDPFEHGRRKFLNLGHTFGHAVEAATDFSWRHGDAVSVGLATVTRWAMANDALNQDVGARIIDALGAAGLPTAVSPELAERAGAYVGADKKSGAGEIHLIVPQGLAQCTLMKLSLDEARDGLVQHGGQ